MGQTVSSFCSSASRAIQDSFNIGRPAHFLGGDEPASRSRDARFIDVGETVDSFRAGNRRSARTSRNTPYTAANIIRAMGMLNVQRPTALPRTRDRAVMTQTISSLPLKLVLTGPLIGSCHTATHVIRQCREDARGPVMWVLGDGVKEIAYLRARGVSPFANCPGALQRCLQDLQVILN